MSSWSLAALLACVFFCVLGMRAAFRRTPHAWRFSVMALYFALLAALFGAVAFGWLSTWVLVVLFDATVLVFTVARWVKDR